MKYLFIFLCFLPLSNAYADLIAVERPKDLQIIPIDTRKSVTPCLKIDAWLNKENRTYYVNEELKLYIKSYNDCYITILELSTGGGLKTIFPNTDDKNNLVRSGETISIPRSNKYIFKVNPPTGRNIIKIIATKNNNQSLIHKVINTKKGKVIKTIDKNKSIASIVTSIFTITHKNGTISK